MTKLKFVIHFRQQYLTCGIILERITFSMPTVSFEEEKIKRASILVLTYYRKIRTLTMIIR